MIITVKTLVDITETLTRKGPDIKLVKQQNNHDTILQACSLRGNVLLLNCVSVVDTINFGSANKSKNRYWSMKLESDYPFTEAMLIDDLDFLPIITDLDETGLIHNNIVLTKDDVYKNTIFLIDG
tara:strand:- start:7952 stop:8326 length:375 start_codon:yes stop_codon:yes gene_type:complete